jgi:hypothetical protein
MSIRSALAALEAEGIQYCLRNGLADMEPVQAGGDVDVVVRPDELSRAEEQLRRAGFVRYRVSGQGSHRFWLGWDSSGRWLKIDLMTTVDYPGGVRVSAETLVSRRWRRGDLWVASDEDVAFHRDMRLRHGKQEIGALARVRAGVRRRRPAGVRRTGPVIAVLGPDGAGKSTTIRQCAKQLPIGVSLAYLGLGRGGRSDAPSAAKPVIGLPAAPAKHAPAAGRGPNPVRESAYLMRNALRWWSRLASAYATAWTGRPVICDRHPIELMAIRPERTRMGSWVERWLFEVMTPEPDAVVLLDAPGEVMFARKGEYDIATLEQRREAFRQVFLPRGATLIATDGQPSRSAATLADVVRECLAVRQGWSRISRPQLIAEP